MSDDVTRQTGGIEDAELLASLGRALDAIEPIPDDAIATASSAVELGTADAELADLVLDTLHDSPALALRHSGAQEARSLSFIAQGYRVDVELIDEGELLGQLEPAEAATVALEAADGVRPSTADDLGRFRFNVARGSLRLRVTTSAGLVVVTPWITW